MIDPGVAGRSARRWNVIGAIGFPLAGAFHAAFIVMFLALDVPSLALVNVVSSLIYGVAIVLHRRGHLIAPLLLLEFEVMAHGALASYIVGWDTGFIVFVPLAGLLPFMTPVPHRVRWGVGLALVNIAVFASVAVATVGRQPEVVLETGVVQTLAAVNGIVASVLIGVATYVFTTSTTRAEAELVAAHERLEVLIHNMLPDVVADRLKAGEQKIADGFDMVTVAFLDLVGFTAYADTASPSTVVTFLDDVFERLDDVARRHAVEKIKTTGDGYLVAAGLPQAQDDHAAAVADFVLEVLAEPDTLPSGATILMRAGIHSGPVVAGVIGSERLAYDVWGDTVNVASRMEALATPGTALVTDATRAHLDPTHLLVDGGERQVKGKGMVRTWRLDRRRTVGDRRDSGDDRSTTVVRRPS